MHRLLIAFALAVALGPALADERAAIAQQRQSLNQRFAAEESDCAKRFQVTACVEDLRARRRQALAPLRERELQLDEAERGRIAVERRAAIAAKREAMAARAPAPPAPQWKPRDPLPPSKAASRPQVSAAASAAASAVRAADAQRRVIDAQDRQRQAQEVRLRIMQRQQEHGTQGLKHDPWPSSPASAPVAR